MFTQDDVRTYSDCAEVKRILSTAESMLPSERNCSVGITSAQRGEGKTLMAASLAVAALHMHRNYRVLLVDLNWHDPSLHESFGIDLHEETPPGYADPFQAFPQQTKISGLDVVVPTKSVIRASLELDSSHEFARRLIAWSCERYNLVIVDTRSLFPVNREMRIDPVKICADLDSVILVAMAAVTPRQTVKRALKMLETAGAKNLGVALNQWKNPLH